MLTSNMDAPVSVETLSESDRAVRSIQSIQQELSGALIDTKLKNGAGRFASSNPVLQPAFDYIYAHKHENFSLKEMAKLCHISPSYFSRIFTKETGRISPSSSPGSRLNGPSGCWNPPIRRSIK